MLVPISHLVFKFPCSLKWSVLVLSVVVRTCSIQTFGTKCSSSPGVLISFSFFLFHTERRRLCTVFLHNRYMYFNNKKFDGSHGTFFPSY